MAGSGELVPQFNDRVAATVSRIAQAHVGERIAIVTHGGWLSAMTSLLVNPPKSGSILRNCSVSRVVMGVDPNHVGSVLVAMETWGDSQHLASVALLTANPDVGAMQPSRDA